MQERAMPSGSEQLMEYADPVMTLEEIDHN
jgi:hypothetical protein